MLRVTFATILAIVSAGSCSYSSSPREDLTARADSMNSMHNVLTARTIRRKDLFHERDTISIVSKSPLPSSALPSKGTTDLDVLKTSSTVSATLSPTSTPLPDVPYAPHSDGSSITLAIIVSIIGGALLLTLAGWAWRKQKEKKSFGPDDHDAELARHKIVNACGASGGAGRHYGGDMVEVDSVPHQRSPVGQRYASHY